jgi:heme-degrading monooxygenase HmoA
VTQPFCAGQVVTVFRSRLRDDVDPRYEALDAELRARAHALGGLVDVTSFTAEDGERVTVVTFEDRASHERWANDAVHRDAQRLGRESVYAAYSIQVGECRHASSFDVRPPGATPSPRSTPAS